MATLYHGSAQVVSHPEFGRGRANNDFGRGFYCTTDVDLAREWACKLESDGFANRYALGTAGLQKLDLLDGSFTTLNWIALLLKNRQFRLRYDVAQEARDYLVERFLPDTSRADIVVGYRADDSYFDYARAFVENGLSVQQLSRALVLGKLGEQVVLVSEQAFNSLRFEGAEPVKRAEWYPRFARHDIRAREAYRQAIKGKPSAKDDLFVIDIMRGGLDGDDPRIPRMLRD